MTNPYPAEFRERALRMLAEARRDHPSDLAAASHVAGRLGVNPETLRLWKKRADSDAGREPGTSSEAQVQIKRLKKQISELERANEILRSASVFFRYRARPPLIEMIALIDVMLDRFGAELVCRTMRAAEVGFVSARGYRAGKSRRRPRSPENASAAQTAGLADRPGPDRAAHAIAGVAGVKRGKRAFTTKSDPAGRRRTDLNQRHFRADKPRRLWVVTSPMCGRGRAWPMSLSSPTVSPGASSAGTSHPR